MAKRKWFLLGALGAAVGVVMKLVRGRKQESVQAGHWDTPSSQE